MVDIVPLRRPLALSHSLAGTAVGTGTGPRRVRGVTALRAATGVRSWICVSRWCGRAHRTEVAVTATTAAIMVRPAIPATAAAMAAAPPRRPAIAAMLQALAGAVAVRTVAMVAADDPPAAAIRLEVAVDIRPAVVVGTRLAGAEDIRRAVVVATPAVAVIRPVDITKTRVNKFSTTVSSCCR